ncbi:Zn-ribbon domain-containing OB-fold protein [Streptomyces sp. NPDC001255]|uniref:Zn-ribbon domain-containing OB-fold protein n=1 Tax=Streptomyces sp. NPDC001255 TaxID=3364550 RepID=UPI00368B1423
MTARNPARTSGARQAPGTTARQARADLPTVEAETRPYWEAAAEGRLLIARCGDCGAVHHYPRVMCPGCWSESITAVEALGTGTVYTYSTVHVNDLPPFKERLPYVAALVELTEGPRVMTNIVDCAPEDVSIGMPVRAVFEAIDEGVHAVYFRPTGP